MMSLRNKRPAVAPVAKAQEPKRVHKKGASPRPEEIVEAPSVASPRPRKRSDPSVAVATPSYAVATPSVETATPSVATPRTKRKAAKEPLPDGGHEVAESAADAEPDQVEMVTNKEQNPPDVGVVVAETETVVEVTNAPDVEPHVAETVVEVATHLPNAEPDVAATAEMTDIPDAGPEVAEAAEMTDIPDAGPELAATAEVTNAPEAEPDVAAEMTIAPEAEPEVAVEVTNAPEAEPEVAAEMTIAPEAEPEVAVEVTIAPDAEPDVAATAIVTIAPEAEPEIAAPVVEAVKPTIPVRDSPAARAAMNRARVQLSEPPALPESDVSDEEGASTEEEDLSAWTPTTFQSGFQSAIAAKRPRDVSAPLVTAEQKPRNDSVVPPVHSSQQVFDVLDSDDEQEKKKRVKRRPTGRGGRSAMVLQAALADPAFEMDVEFTRGKNVPVGVSYLTALALAPEMLMGNDGRMVLSGSQLTPVEKLFTQIGLSIPNCVKVATFGNANVSFNPENIMNEFYGDEEVSERSTGRKVILGALLDLPRDNDEPECTVFVSVADALNMMAKAGRASKVTSSPVNSFLKILTAAVSCGLEDLLYVEGGEGERIDLAHVCAPVAEMLQGHLKSGDLGGFKTDFVKYCRHPGLKELFTAWNLSAPAAVSSEAAIPAKRRKTDKKTKKSRYEEDEEEEEWEEE
jgi:hypothetical protein